MKQQKQIQNHILYINLLVIKKTTLWKYGAWDGLINHVKVSREKNV